MSDKEQERIFKYLKSLNGDINVYQGAIIEILDSYITPPDEKTLKRILNKHKSRVRRAKMRNMGWSEHKKEFTKSIVFVNNFEKETRL